MKILLVEDDSHLAEDISKQLTADGYIVEACFDGMLAEKLITRNEYDCILMDVNLPGKNGLEVCKSIRGKEIHTPVIMVTSFGELDDRISGFDSGADDYISKPFYYRELLARIKVATKRGTSAGGASHKFILADMVIDYNKKKVTRAGTEIKLTSKEYELLKTLAMANGNPVSKQFLLENVWGTVYGVNTNTIEVFINLIRNKIDKGHSPKLIKTKVGFGYLLNADEA